MIIRKCGKCGKIIEGFTEGQADYNLKAHQISNKCRVKNEGK